MCDLKISAVSLDRVYMYIYVTMQKKDRSDLLLRKKLSHNVIRGLYSRVRGIEICLSHKDELDSLRSDESDTSLTYGEIVSTSFEQLLVDALRTLVSLGRRPTNLVFYDLGSGTGKAIITTGLCFAYNTFTSAIGLEIVPSLHEAACGVLRRFRNCITAAEAEASSEKVIRSKTSSAVACAVGSKTKDSSNSSKSSKHILPMSTAELEAVIRKVLLAHGESSGIELARLANKVCLSIGSKPFKAAFKPSIHGTFSFFVEKGALNGLWHLTDDGLVQQLHESPPLQQKEDEIEKTNIFTMSSSDTGADLIPIDDDHIDPVQRLLVEQGGSTLWSQAIYAATVDKNDVAFKEEIRETLSENTTESLNNMHFELADIFTRDWPNDADIIYCASLLFTDAMLVQLAEMVCRMKPSSVFLCLKELPFESITDPRVNRVRLVSRSFYQMSWQKAEVLTYCVE